MTRSRVVRVASFALERPRQLAQQAGDILMFGSDWRHREGLVDPVTDFTTATGATPTDQAPLWSANAASLIHTD